MPQFRIALGYRTAHRRSKPEVIASGFAPEELQAAIDAAGEEFIRFEVGAFHFVKKGRRRNSIHKAQSPQTKAADTSAVQARSVQAEEQPSAEDTLQDDDGPSLLPPTGPRRRK